MITREYYRDFIGTLGTIIACKQRELDTLDREDDEAEIYCLNQEISYYKNAVRKLSDESVWQFISKAKLEEYCNELAKTAFHMNSTARMLCDDLSQLHGITGEVFEYFEEGRWRFRELSQAWNCFNDFVNGNL